MRTTIFQLHIPTRTILKLLLWAFLTTVAVKLWPELVYLSLSLLLAVALGPVVNRLCALGLGRGASVSLIAVGLLGCAALFVAFVLPPLVHQAGEVAANFPAFRRSAQQHMPSNPFVRSVMTQLLQMPSSPEVVHQLNKPLVWGQLALSGVATTIVVLVIALYLLLDGRRLYAWLLAYVPRRHREKMARTVPEVSEVVFGYVRGQLVVSLLFALFSAIVLRLLGVPASLPLAVMAGVCDIIPVVGIVIATGPAMLMALTVSPGTALTVGCLYFAYHLLEAYVIVPRLYGKNLRLSTLGVLLAVIVGGSLQGILGAVVVLPLVAAYPIIERIWLKSYLAPEVIQDHSALVHAAETGRDTAIDAVLNGEEHPLAPRRS
ncbi:MAG TPA: AI-2E family transporter [Polyangiaceae bacterium]